MRSFKQTVTIWGLVLLLGESDTHICTVSLSNLGEWLIISSDLSDSVALNDDEIKPFWWKSVDWGYKCHATRTEILHRLFAYSWKWSSCWWQRLMHATSSVYTQLILNTSWHDCTRDLRHFANNNTNKACQRRIERLPIHSRTWGNITDFLMYWDSCDRIVAWHDWQRWQTLKN
jgi:hypothetical protein